MWYPPIQEAAPDNPFFFHPAQLYFFDFCLLIPSLILCKKYSLRKNKRTCQSSKTRTHTEEEEIAKEILPAKTLQVIRYYLI
ncbi:MAG: hypothetical protein H3C36_04945 [Chitinophagaceae bacterium]|nr:hypothetical protein [Chitinophagaceae bacterium]MCW5914547.1 hypothetical protein [Chitinophagaceae bacterium]MCZ2395348.1 hypothetical protein [Chitinophagales bacterium]